MRKCCMDEVPALVISLAVQRANKVQYNWAQYLCREFLANYREAQEERKLFHYDWLLLLILLVAWRFLEDSQFPLQNETLPEATKFASLWQKKDAERIIESKVFWVFMEMDIRMAINQRPRLSPILFKQIRAFAEFKVDFHNVWIHSRRDPKKVWHKLPYLVAKIYVQEVVGGWPEEWHKPQFDVGTSEVG